MSQPPWRSSAKGTSFGRRPVSSCLSFLGFPSDSLWPKIQRKVRTHSLWLLRLRKPTIRKTVNQCLLRNICTACEVKFSGSTGSFLLPHAFIHSWRTSKSVRWRAVPHRLLWPLHFHHAPIPWFCRCRLQILPLPTPHCPYSRFWLLPTFSLLLVHWHSLLVGSLFKFVSFFPLIASQWSLTTPTFRPWRMFHALSRFPALPLSVGCQMLWSLNRHLGMSLFCLVLSYIWLTMLTHRSWLVDWSHLLS